MYVYECVYRLFNELEADNENHYQRTSIQNSLNAKRFSVSKDKNENENVWHTPLLYLTSNAHSLALTFIHIVWYNVTNSWNCAIKPKLDVFYLCIVFTVTFIAAHRQCVPLFDMKMFNLHSSPCAAMCCLCVEYDFNPPEAKYNQRNKESNDVINCS